MRGFEVLFAFGIDRNGLPVEIEVEKKHNISAKNIPREKFLEMCKRFLEEVEAEIISTAKRIGMSSNFNEIYRTDSPEYRRITQQTFIELWNKGLVYVDNRPTNWCPVCGTTIADAELEYREMDTQLNYIKFQLKDGGEIVIATTRPELLCSCAAVIFHPEDDRYKNLEGKQAVTPIYRREVPIFAHPSAKPEFGTGLAMICSYGDYTDIRLFRELKLNPIIAINTDGRMNEAAGPYQGLKVEEARKQIIEDLKKRGFLVKQETVKHKVPTCWRSKNPIEFISMPEYYLKQLSFLEELRKIVYQINFHPPEARQFLLNWIDSITVDWPISRRRFYGTEIPIWYCAKCGKPHLPKPGKYYQPWRERPPFEKCESCGSKDFKGEERTFDTWMDSSISPLFIIGYGRNERLFSESFPCSLRPQGVDIVRTWLYYSVLRAYQLFKRKAFREVRISGMGLDEHGEAMHKSKGNIIWPEPIFEKYGADAFRFWGAAEARLGSDYRFSWERLEGASRFVTKIWNIARFTSSFPQVDFTEVELQPLDEMILGKLNETIMTCVKGYEAMDVFPPAQAIRSFLWKLFADHYLEAVKPRAYNMAGEFGEDAQKAAWWTLHECMKTSLKLLAPICPYITEAIWRKVYSEKSIHLESFPEPRPELETKLVNLTEKFQAFNSAIWKFKKDRNFPLKSEVNLVYAPVELKPFEVDLKAMHKIGELRFGVPAKKEEYAGYGEVYILI
jgi:valyl-tRNA synthetase